MTLENLVPPPELCKKIPTGAFADSALVWVLDDPASSYEEMVIPRECYDFCSMHPSAITAPAPTLAEIMLSLDQAGYTPVVDRPDLFDEEARKNPSIAALKLWLELEGEK